MRDPGSPAPPSGGSAPPHPPLAAGIVDVWRADFTDSERSREVLTALLGGYLQIDPSAVRLTVGAHGKPELSDPSEHDSPQHPPQQVAFNISHSGDLAVYAFTAGLPVGVDVELLHNRSHRFDEVALALRAFGAERVRSLKALDGEARRREFLRLWVRHEAALKCLGTGLLAGGSGTSGTAPGLADHTGLWIAELDLGSDATAALAVAGGPQELRLWDCPTSG